MAAVTSDNVPMSCPVTKPSARPFISPAPFPENVAPAAEFWLGTQKLWTVLPASGMWDKLPHYTPADPTFRNKLFWWRHGSDSHADPKPRLTITGRRIDTPAPPLHVDPVRAGWARPDSAKVVGVNFPTLGCWEITAQYESAKVTYIVWLTQ